jgi:hypothetical protein
VDVFAALNARIDTFGLRIENARLFEIIRRRNLGPFPSQHLADALDGRQARVARDVGLKRVIGVVVGDAGRKALACGRRIARRIFGRADRARGRRRERHDAVGIAQLSSAPSTVRVQRAPRRGRVFRFAARNSGKAQQ